MVMVLAMVTVIMWYWILSTKKR